MNLIKRCKYDYVYKQSHIKIKVMKDKYIFRCIDLKKPADTPIISIILPLSQTTGDF